MSSKTVIQTKIKKSHNTLNTHIPFHISFVNNVMMFEFVDRFSVVFFMTCCYGPLALTHFNNVR